MYQQYRVNRDMLQIARRQFCMDTCLDWQQYLEHPEKKCYIQKTKYKSGTPYPEGEGARQYFGMDSFFKAIICMGQLFLAADEQIYDWAVEKFSDCSPEWFCAYGNLRMIDRKLEEYGRKINDTHVYFLPVEEYSNGIPQMRKQDMGESLQLQRDKTVGRVQDLYQWYNQEDILCFRKNNQFTSAICFSPTQPDMLAVAAERKKIESVQKTVKQNRAVQKGIMHNGVEKEGRTQETEKVEKPYCEKEFNQEKLAGMAGVSADGEYLWQIGINVVPEFAGHGLGGKLVRRLKDEVIRLGKIPFYGTSESHAVSQTIAIKAGFMPAWTEIYVKRIEK